MNFKNGWRRVARLWQSDTVAKVDEELQFHFEQKVAEFEEQGSPRAEARRRAEEEFGDVEAVKNSLRTIDARIVQKQRRAEWWESIAQDLRYVFRSLSRSPGFAITVIVTLALGLGANGALFSVLDRLYVQEPAGVQNVAQLRRIYRTFKGPRGPFIFDRFTAPNVRAFRELAPPNTQIVSYDPARVIVDGSGSPVGAAYVEGDLFGVLGVRPSLGRLFAPEETRIEGLQLVAVLSHAYWRGRYAGDSSVIGRSINVGPRKYTIVGVAAANFNGLDLDTPDIWLPLNTQGNVKQRDPHWYEQEPGVAARVIVRSPSEASSDLFGQRATALLRQNLKIGSDSPSVFIRPVVEARNAENFGTELSITTRLAGVSLVILLIAVANVTNLMLARAASREREVALRVALGVSRQRLLAQLLMESVVLAVLASAVSLLVAHVGATMLRNLLFPDIHWASGTMDLRVALFTGGLAVGTGIVAGLISAHHAAHPNLVRALKAGVRDGGRKTNSMRSVLIVAQAALSVVLLSAAGVFVSSLNSVQQIDTGFDLRKLIFASVSYDFEMGNRRDEIKQQLPQVVERLRNFPGVESVALSEVLPMSGFTMRPLTIPGQDSLPPTKQLRLSVAVSPEYFATVGLRVIRGRSFTSEDRAESEPVIVLDENLAQNLWPSGESLGKCVIVGQKSSPCRRIIGIVENSHYGNFIEDPSMHHYLPTAQLGNEAGAIIVRARDGSVSAISNLALRELSRTYGSWARPNVRTMETAVAKRLRPWRTGAVVFTAAALLALLVAAVGIYSSISYAIAQRTRELGVRVALGASASNIARLVFGAGARTVGIGVAVGVALTLALGRFVASLLYQVSPRDPIILSGAAVVLMLATLLACALPAWRASRADPLDAMRAE